ncbi:hypothetical protein GWK47_054888 [Chionoecetes opilio]|uniref:Uncharacterized protein n=1 Tax=Chionoecetes opilio TaxID=41210 RepID=A0A8J4Y5P1_CHIOP|nr:hypothetical protein GWK47_054888 [Chionoecetes opilio]
MCPYHYLAGGLKPSTPIGPPTLQLCFSLRDVRDSGRKNVPHPGDAATKCVCWLAQERGTSTAHHWKAPFRASVVIWGGCRPPNQVGTPAPVPGGIPQPRKTLRCSSDRRTPRARTGRVGGGSGGSRIHHSQGRRGYFHPECGLPRIQEGGRTLKKARIWGPFRQELPPCRGSGTLAGRDPVEAFFSMCLMWPSKTFCSRSPLYSQNL